MSAKLILITFTGLLSTMPMNYTHFDEGGGSQTGLYETPLNGC